MLFFEALQMDYLDQDKNVLREVFNKTASLLALIKAEAQALEPHYPKSTSMQGKLSKKELVKVATYCDFIYTLEEALDLVMTGLVETGQFDEPYLIKMSLNLTLKREQQGNNTTLVIGLLSDKSDIIQSLKDAFGLSLEAPLKKKNGYPPAQAINRLN